MRHIKLYSALTLTACFAVACSAAQSPQDATSSPSPAQHQAASTGANVVTTKAAAQMTPLERGAILFKRCRACHTLDEGGRNKVGPNLWAIWGAKAASHDGFAYSKALKESGIVWDDETMDAYIRKPREAVPGTRMSFAGIKKAEDRQALMLYLKSKTTP